MRKWLIFVLAFSLLIGSQPTLLAKLSPGDYIDVQKHWAQEVVQEVSARGIMQGTGTNEQGFKTFLPDKATTRSQAAAVLVRTFALDTGGKTYIKQPLASDFYQDVDNQAWYANAVLMCAINGVLKSSDTFYPDQPVSRLEMALAVQQSFNARQISIPIIQMLPVYDDTNDLQPGEQNAVAFVTFTGIMKGYGSYFRPGDNMTRAELAQVALRCWNLINNYNKIDESYNEQEYRVPAGQTFTLSLDGNPTTGYQWVLDDSFDGEVLSLLENFYLTPQSAAQMVGQGGSYYWRFKALKAGSTEIKIAYCRPWEDTSPVQTFNVKVIVIP